MNNNGSSLEVDVVGEHDGDHAVGRVCTGASNQTPEKKAGPVETARYQLACRSAPWMSNPVEELESWRQRLTGTRGPKAPIETSS